MLVEFQKYWLKKLVLKVKTSREVMQIVVGMKRRGHWLLESRSMNKTFSHNQIILRSEILRADC